MTIVFKNALEEQKLEGEAHTHTPKKKKKKTEKAEK